MELTEHVTETIRMKKCTLSSAWLNAVLGICCALFSAGCGSTRGYQQADKTGEAINTVRNDIVNVKSAVDDSMKALDGLAATATTDPRKAYETFAKSVDKVEKAANTAKADADEMNARGAEYFKNWETELAAVKSPEIRKLAQERRGKLQEAFGTIKTAAEATKASFPPFLSNLKDLRTALSSDLTVQGIAAAKGIFAKTKSNGVEVQKHLDELVAELNTVVATVTPAKAK
jgi:hypothetical protein